MIQPLHTLTRFGLVARARPDGNDPVQAALNALREDQRAERVHVSQGKVLATHEIHPDAVRNSVTRLLGGGTAQEFMRTVQSGDADGRTSQVLPAIQSPSSPAEAKRLVVAAQPSASIDVMKLNEDAWFPRSVFDAVVEGAVLGHKAPVDGDLIYIEFHGVRFWKGQCRCVRISIGPLPLEHFGRYSSEILVEYYRGDWVIREQLARYAGSSKVGVAALAAALIKELNFKRDGKGFPKRVPVYPTLEQNGNVTREVLRVMDDASFIQKLPEPRIKPIDNTTRGK